MTNVHDKELHANFVDTLRMETLLYELQLLLRDISSKLLEILSDLRDSVQSIQCLHERQHLTVEGLKGLLLDAIRACTCSPPTGPTRAR